MLIRLDKFHWRSLAVLVFMRGQLQGMPVLPKVDAAQVAQYFVRDLQVFVREIDQKAVTNGSDKALLVHIYTESLLIKVTDLLGDAESARMICGALRFMAASCPVCKGDADSLMSAWSAYEPSEEEIHAATSKPLEFAISLGAVSVAETLMRSGIDCLDSDARGLEESVPDGLELHPAGFGPNRAREPGVGGRGGAPGQTISK